MSVGPLNTLSVILSGLEVSQEQSDVASQNIAGASDPNYARETPVVVPVTGTPVPMAAGTTPGGTYDGGVAVINVVRQAASYLSASNRAQQAQAAYAKTWAEGLSSAQAVFQATGSNSPSAVMETFFNSLSTLSQSPTNLGALSTVVGNAQTVAQTFNTLAASLGQQAANARGQLGDQIAQDNQLLTQVAQLNRAITAGAMAGDVSNALVDQRSGYLNQLAQDLGATVQTIPVTTPGGQPVDSPSGQPVDTIQVRLPDGTVLVDGTHAGTLAVQSGPPATRLSATTPGGTTVTPTFTGTQGGTVGALLQLLNGPLSGDGSGSAANSLLNQVDQVANTLATQVNQLQTASSAYYLSNPATKTLSPSSPSHPLFVAQTGTTISAATIGVAPAMVQNPYELATSQSATDANNGANAEAMASLQNASAGPVAAFTRVMVAVGTGVQSASDQQTTQSALASQTLKAWQSVSGVNVNQAVAGLATAAQQYAALAKAMGAVQTMVNNLLNAVI